MAGPPDHLLIPVYLSELIEAVYVTPGAWYGEVTREVMNRFGLVCEVRPSAMDDEPLLELHHRGAASNLSFGGCDMRGICDRVT